MFRIKYTKRACKDIPLLTHNGLDTRAHYLIDVLRNDPFQTPPPFEALRGNLSGLYSRRITYQHRIVYQVDKTPYQDKKTGKTFDGVVKIIRLWTHYEGVH